MDIICWILSTFDGKGKKSFEMKTRSNTVGGWEEGCGRWGLGTPEEGEFGRRAGDSGPHHPLKPGQTVLSELSKQRLLQVCCILGSSFSGLWVSGWCACAAPAAVRQRCKRRYCCTVSFLVSPQRPPLPNFTQLYWLTAAHG